tara:strand:+ start:835 stop:1881 length:1047 start_codon:yes stop_codon:yes gene_type:complete
MVAQTSTQIAREAPFLEDYRRRLLDSVYGGTEVYKEGDTLPPGKKIGDKKDPGLLDTPVDQFQRGIASFAPTESAAFTEASRQMGIDPATGQRTGVASFEPFIQQAQQGLTSAMGTTALGIPSLQAAQQQFDPTTARTSDFMNQYQADVTQEALKQLDEQAAKAQSQLASSAQKAGAFGGSRFGVQEAELAKNLQDIKSKRVFEDLSRNFMQAQQAAIGTSESARARELQSAPVYGQLGQTAGTQALGFGNLGAQQFGLGQQGIQSLLGTGQVQRTRDQALADEDFRFRTAQSLEPRQRIQFGSDILAATPSIQQSTTQQPIPYTNPLAAAVGSGVAGLGALGAMYSQ